MAGERTIEKVTYRRGPVGWFFKIAFIAFNLAMLAWLLSYCADVSTRLDEGSEAEQAGAVVGFGIGVAVLTVIWLSGAAVLGILTAFTRGAKVIDRISAAILASAGCTAGTAVDAAEDELRRGLATCAGAEGDLARLACYHKLAAENGLEGPQPVETGAADAGKWQVGVDRNPVDDTTRVVLLLAADSGRGRFGEPASLVARCQSNETDLYANWESFLGSDDAEVRVGRDKATVERWNLSTDHKSTFARAPIPLLRRMARADGLLLQVPPYSESPVTAVFDTRGLARAVEPLAKECGWSVVSK